VKLRTLGALLAVATVAATAACSSSGGSKSDNTVTWMSWETVQTNAAMDASFATFTKSSGITMQREEAPNADYAQKLASLIMSKKVPDFFWCSTAEEQTLASQHLLYDWSSYAAKNQGLDMSKFSPGSLDAWKADGKLYGIPTLANTYGFFYNKKLFDAAGVPVPVNGWTYDQMFADAAALTNKNGAKYGLVTQWTLLTSPHGLAQYSVSAGGPPLSDSAIGVKSITISPQAIQAAHRYATAIKAGQITPAETDEGNSSSAFANGSVPMMFGGQWLAQTLVGQKLGFDWGFVTMPRVNADVQPIESNGVCSPATLKNPDQVWKAISYLETTGFNDTMKKVPVAPIAYQPGSEGYFAALQGQGPGPESMAAAIKASLAAPTKVQTGFLDPWSSKALDIEKADWNPAIDGKTDTDAGIAKTVKDINSLASSSH
jgi:ABC-type glycerol-3-phosphate transport system substrate-binding protein